MVAQLKQDEDLFFPLPFWFLILCLWKYFISRLARINQRLFRSEHLDSSKAFQSIRPQIIGHRGSRGTNPENSMEGFQIASKIADGFELDTQLCKTGELIVLHDTTLDRTSSAQGPVSRFTRDELKNIQLENGENVPILQDVLRRFTGKTWINIEIKKENTSKDTKKSALELAQLLKRNYSSEGEDSNWVPKHNLNHDIEDSVNDGTRNNLNKIIVSSFSPLALYYFRKFSSQTSIAQLIADGRTSQVSGWKGKLLSSYFFANSLNTKAVVWEKTFLLDYPEQIEYLHKLGKKVYVYTSNEEVEWRFFSKYKLDGIITDFPKIAKEFILSPLS